jgi:hypothetical protein
MARELFLKIVAVPQRDARARDGEPIDHAEFLDHHVE